MHTSTEVTSYIPGRQSPAPPCWKHRPHVPLHQRLQHPRMKCKGVDPELLAGACESNLLQSQSAALTLRALRKSFVARPLTPDDDTSVDRNSLRGFDDTGNWSAAVVPLPIPTAEDVAEGTVEFTGRKLLHPPAPPHRYQTQDSPWRNEPSSPTRRKSNTDSSSSANAAAARGPEASPRSSFHHSRHFAERLHRSDFDPPPSMVEEAMVKAAAMESPPHFVRNELRGIPSNHIAGHDQLMEAMLKDHVCAVIKEQHEQRLKQRAAIFVTRSTSARNARRSSFVEMNSGPRSTEVGKQMLENAQLSRKLDHHSTNMFPVSSRLLRLAHEVNAAAHEDNRPSTSRSTATATETLEAQMHAARLAKNVKKFLYPSYVTPNSRRYGSKKYHEPPKRMFAYEDHGKDEDDPLGLIAQFETTTKREL